MNIPSRFIDEIDKDLLDIQNINLEEPKKINKSTLYNDADNVGEYKNGDQVIHTIFGRGVVVAQDDTFLSIAFAKNYGLKKILKTYKGIRKV